MKFLIIIAALITLNSATFMSRVYRGECIYQDDGIMRYISEWGCFQLILQEDGNMVIYRISDKATNTNNKGGFKACMQCG